MEIDGGAKKLNEIITASSMIRSGKKFGLRHVQVFMMFLCFTIAYALRVNLSVAIVAMTSNSTNGNVEIFSWSEQIKGKILSSFFWTYLLIQIPSGHLAERYGAKYILALGMFVCGISTLLTPLIAYKFDYVGVIIMRLILGLAQGSLLPSIVALISKWVPPSERNRAYTVALTGVNAGTLIMLPISGMLAASNLGWPSIFYFSGGIALIWSILWILIGASTPADQKLISAEEKQYIESELQQITTKNNFKTPWKEIIRSAPMYAIIFAHLGQNWGFWILLTQTPNYIQSVLGFNISSNGFLSALPHLVGWFSAFLFSYMADFINRRKLLSRTNQRKFWNSVAQWGGGFCLLLLAVLNNPSPYVAIALLTISMGLNSGILNGFLTNHVELSPNFCGTLMGISNAAANFTSIAGPIFVGIIIGIQNTEKEWKLVFTVTFFGMFLINSIYVLFASGEVQPWNDITEKEKREEENPARVANA